MGMFLWCRAQYNGMGVGHNLRYVDYDRDNMDVWPAASKAFIVLDWFFGIIFTMEVILKITGRTAQHSRTVI